MNEFTQMPPDKNKKFWLMAERRVKFKYNLAAYIILNTFFWILWFLTDGDTHQPFWPWPVWPMLGWGIGLAFHYMGAYVFPKDDAIEKEYEKLKKEQEK